MSVPSVASHRCTSGFTPKFLEYLRASCPVSCGECKDEATAREAGIVSEQEDKLATRRELARTKANEAAWSRNALPQISTGASAAGR